MTYRCLGRWVIMRHSIRTTTAPHFRADIIIFLKLVSRSISGRSSMPSAIARFGYTSYRTSILSLSFMVVGPGPCVLLELGAHCVSRLRSLPPRCGRRSIHIGEQTPLACRKNPCRSLLKIYWFVADERLRFIAGAEFKKRFCMEHHGDPAAVLLIVLTA